MCRFHGWILLAAAACGACGGEPLAPQVNLGNEDQAFSSAEATPLDFSFDGELITADATSSTTVKQKIQDQLLYTIGQLNGNRSVGRLDRLVLSNLHVSALGTGAQRVRYHAVLPVAWGAKTNLPAQYVFTLPKRVTYEGLASFTQKYVGTCVDPSAHDVEPGSMWYYFRPRRTGCSLSADDVLPAQATVTTSAQNTTGKYPELHKVWEDGALNFVAIFGKNKDGATQSTDEGIEAYNRFIQAVRTEFSPYQATTVPAGLPSEPGVGHPDVTIQATLPEGKTVSVHALLVDNVRTAGPTFDARYEALSPTADVLMYNGHAGLGSSVRALARKGRFVRGQYVIVFMNGCDTFAYVDGSLAEARARVNPEDPSGTRYMDIVTNAMPAFFHQLPSTSLALLRGLMRPQAPATYEQMFRNVDRNQVVVTGEEDNVFAPGQTEPHSATEYLRIAGTVAYREEARQSTPLLFAGTYRVSLSPATPQGPGDADLYVRAQAAPSLNDWDCRPFQKGSNESCELTLEAPGVLHMLIVGYGSGSSPYVLTVSGESQPDRGSVPAASWSGLDEQFTLERGAEQRFQTPPLPPGRYTFELSGTGDADLYLRQDAAPSQAAFNCRPFRTGSSERCQLELTEAHMLHLLVRSDASSSTVRLVGRAQ